MANIDFAPTFIDLVDGSTLPNVDGISIEPLLHPKSNKTVPFRDAVLIEHQGEYLPDITGCPQYKNQNMNVGTSISHENFIPFLATVNICFVVELNAVSVVVQLYNRSQFC